MIKKECNIIKIDDNKIRREFGSVPLFCKEVGLTEHTVQDLIQNPRRFFRGRSKSFETYQKLRDMGYVIFVCDETEEKDDEKQAI